MTTVRYDLAALSVEVTGHARPGWQGEDIVCAGISAVSFGLLNAATVYDAEISVDEDSAEILLRCFPTEEQKPLCREMLRTALTMYGTIRRDYPDDILIEEVYNG